MFTGVSGKEGTLQLASKALMKKSATKSFGFEENTIKEPVETEDSVQTVINCLVPVIYTVVKRFQLNEILLLQGSKGLLPPLPETDMCETATLCGEV